MVPDVFEPFRAAERRRGDVGARERQQPLLLIRIADQGLERLGDAIGRRALSDDLTRDECGNRAFRHAAGDRLHDLRAFVGGPPFLEQPQQHLG